LVAELRGIHLTDHGLKYAQQWWVLQVLSQAHTGFRSIFLLHLDGVADPDLTDGNGRQGHIDRAQRHAPLGGNELQHKLLECWIRKHGRCVADRKSERALDGHHRFAIILLATHET
jgi:hypothetical protein